MIPQAVQPRGDAYEAAWVIDTKQTAAVFAALGHPIRLRIVQLLATRGDQDVGMLAAALGQSVANTSHHLAGLRQAGLVRSEPHGTRVTTTLERNASESCAALLALIGLPPSNQRARATGSGS